MEVNFPPPPSPNAPRGPEIRELNLKCSFPQSGEDEDEEDRKGRKKIRKIMKDDKLRMETRDALKEEEDRRKRIADREALREKLREVNGSDRLSLQHSGVWAESHRVNCELA